jgi:glycosyltransferase involved in cell wall biosynthesis
MTEISVQELPMPVSTPQKRVKVLLSAYACEPHRGSEPGKGWNVTMRITQGHDVWVIVRADHRNAIEAELKENPKPNIKWIFYDLPYWMRFWRKGLRGINFHYYMWQLGAFFKAKQLHRDVHFDIIHHVSYSRYWQPSFMPFIDVPFIWGPVGGGESVPSGLYKSLSFRGRLLEYLRNFIRVIGNHDPFVRKTANRATIRLATTMETFKELRKFTSKPISILPAIALSDEDREKLRKLPDNDSSVFRFFCIGRLVEWKGFHLGLKSFVKFQEKFPHSEYWIIGDGPQRKYLTNLAKKLGVQEKVRFWGDLSREQVFERLAECNVVVHPSLHDSGGWVCLEAMASRRPVICLDTGGPGILVSEQTGIKISTDSPQQVIDDIANAMLKLANNPELLRQMGEAAQKRVGEEFSWERRGNQYFGIYDHIIR